MPMSIFSPKHNSDKHSIYVLAISIHPGTAFFDIPNKKSRELPRKSAIPFL